MPRKKKPIEEMTTEEVVKELFPKKAIKEIKKVAHEKDKPKPKRKKTINKE